MTQNLSKAMGQAAVAAGLLLGCLGAGAQMRGGSMGGGSGMGQQPGMQQPGMQQPGMQQPNGPNGMQNAREQNLLENLRRNMMAETDLSKLAAKNSQNEAVKKFAQQIVTQNRSSESELSLAASSQGMTLTSDVPGATRKAEKQMKKLTGTQFDAMYLGQINAYIKSDQKLTSQPSTTGSTGQLGGQIMQLRVRADQRAQQLVQVAQAANLKMQ